MIKILKLTIYNKNDTINDLFENRNIQDNKDITKNIENIIKDIKDNGDVAIKEYTKLFDKMEIKDLEIQKKELEIKANQANIAFKESCMKAKNNIEKFHKSQIQNSYINFEDDGVLIGQKVMPIERIGVYVPGGTAAYPSSILMNVIPAKIAGVKEIIMVTPPQSNGSISAEIAFAALNAGVDKVYTIGGAQAIAALAYGTETIKKVDKIVGPGNIYVAIAKKLVYGNVDIDMIAGPSEILIIADETAVPEYIAADLLSQAEHDELAASILVTTSINLYKNVNSQLKKQIENLDRKDIIQKSINKYGRAIICKDMNEAIEVANKFAPEHLEIIVEDEMSYIEKINNAGSIFLGNYSPEAVGDYFAGVNHVLPTNMTARYSSPLSVDSFIKKISFTKYTKKAIEKNAKYIMKLAEFEGLTAHENSIKVRVNKND